MMPHDDRVRETLMQTLHKFTQRTHLFRCTGISRIPCRIQSTLIADPNAILVVTLHMSTRLLNGTTILNRAIPLNIHMITDALPSQ